MLAARKVEGFPVEVDSKQLEERFDRVDVRFDKVDERLDRVDARLEKCEIVRLGGLEVSVAVLMSQFTRLIADVAELKSDVKDLGKRMSEGFQTTHEELAKAKIWALLIAAAMLGVLARGFHWI